MFLFSIVDIAIPQYCVRAATGNKMKIKKTFYKFELVTRYLPGDFTPTYTPYNVSTCSN